MKAPTTGYYSVIQFTLDRSRFEAANVGVLLFDELVGVEITDADAEKMAPLIAGH